MRAVISSGFILKVGRIVPFGLLLGPGNLRAVRFSLTQSFRPHLNVIGGTHTSPVHATTYTDNAMYHTCIFTFLGIHNANTLVCIICLNFFHEEKKIGTCFRLFVKYWLDHFPNKLYNKFNIYQMTKCSFENCIFRRLAISKNSPCFYHCIVLNFNFKYTLKCLDFSHLSKLLIIVIEQIKLNPSLTSSFYFHLMRQYKNTRTLLHWV